MKSTTDKFWMVVRINGAWDSAGNQKLPEEDAPREMFFDYDEALEELLEYQDNIPKGEFVLLEAVAVARQNLGGLLCVENLVE